ncbi:MAG: DUF2199 domain-containing protein [Chloroflexota bacterium]|nr:DUF2199 domain-containing protein [Chloroflexota bacterium]
MIHEGLPFSYGIDAPEYGYAIPESERERRAVLGEEQCEIDGEHFFVRGRIRIPVLDAPDDFEWGAWVSLSPRNYRRMAELWCRPGREAEPPYFGWLSTALPYEPSTLNLKTLVHTRPVGERPLIELEPTDHPLALEQRRGITLERVQEIAERLLHE